MMALNITKEHAALKKMTVTELRRKYAEVFGEPTRSHHREFLVRRIAWRLQAQEEGDISERARKRASEIANDADLRTRPPDTEHEPAGPVVTGRIRLAPHDDRLPLPGALLTREYRGRRIDVRVLPKGFEYEGEVYRSLTAVAKAVTGSHWNGHLFFNLKPPRRADA
jgi:hypothetical protein